MTDQTETIVAIDPVIANHPTGHNYRLMLSCGHWIFWDGQRPREGAAIRCPTAACHPITIIGEIESDGKD